jgi:hypothetical protein
MSAMNNLCFRQMPGPGIVTDLPLASSLYRRAGAPASRYNVSASQWKSPMNVDRIDLNLLRVFDTVVEERNLLQAAKRRIGSARGREPFEPESTDLESIIAANDCITLLLMGALSGDLARNVAV